MIHIWISRLMILWCKDSYTSTEVIRHFYVRGTLNMWVSDLIQQVDLGDRVGGISRVFDQQGNESDKSIQGLETLGPSQRLAVYLLCQGPVAYVHTQLNGETEEARDEVVGLQDPLLVHLWKVIMIGTFTQISFTFLHLQMTLYWWFHRKGIPIWAFSQ